MYNNIITYGTFDLFHIGHLNLLKKLRGMGNKLVVAVSTDAFNQKKGKKTIIPFDQRSEIVKSIKYVDEVIPEESWDQKVNDILRYNIDLFAIGKDWEGKFDFLNEYCTVKYLDRTEGISTTELKTNIQRILSIFNNEIMQVSEILEQIKKEFE
jgi:glycerol-3-phosphate cytidylyltransferase